MIFLVPVTSALARAGLQLHCPAPGFPGAHRGYFCALTASRNESRGKDTFITL